MNNEMIKQGYVSPEVIITFVENDIITASGDDDNISWEGPIVGA